MLVPGPWCPFSGPVILQDFQVLLPHNLSDKLAHFPCFHLDPKDLAKEQLSRKLMLLAQGLATLVRPFAPELQHTIAGGLELPSCSGTSQ